LGRPPGSRDFQRHHGPKPRPVPTNHGLRTDDGNRTCDARVKPVQPNEQRPIAVG
jgi:hypothetical protein